ncbi:TrkA-C domain-containing protein [Haloferax prahovense DSM 18310]|uniref:TrkA-C domain-containing protein n=1 Tax=Haloferax prahovense (strain DSM 18310 / JCM 13924 / TL6) TaxID=1227461 RepID=M0G5X9_HALPT|nr:TrkA C-terminal domain-containing protein [Haloferax prahovense]ELZ66963.1 TrkA-C domain-containing protein [Haloferax prahovense DSM 18310]
MASLPVEVVYGLYFGILTGLVPAAVAWLLGFGFRYVTGVTVPGLAVVVLSVAIAGASGGLMALADPTITQSESQVRLTVALLVVLMGSLYAHNRGDAFANDIPRKMSLRKLTERSLSTDVVELVGGRGQVSVTVTGEVGDIEGYPPVPLDIRTSIRNGEWTFPADIPLVELESRFADRLQNEFDLAAVEVRLDERARATVSAAAPVGGLSKRLPTGKRAVSVTALVPTGLARGDEVVVVTDGGTVPASVAGVESVVETPSDADEDEDEDDAPKAAPRTPTAVGGEGRVTLAVDRGKVESLLGSDVKRFIVTSRGVRREFELVSLLRRAGKRFSRLSVRAESPLDGVTLGKAGVRDGYGVAVLAVRHGGNWTIAPRGDQEISAGDTLYAVGSRSDLTGFEEAVA